MGIREVLELFYFLSGPLLVILGIVGLQQIFVAKKDIYVRSKREAAVLAATQAQLYNEKIIPLLDKFDLLLKEKAVPTYKGGGIDFSYQEVLKRMMRGQLLLRN